MRQIEVDLDQLEPNKNSLSFDKKGGENNVSKRASKSISSYLEPIKR